MAVGEHAALVWRDDHGRDLPVGTAMTATGRLSVARELSANQVRGPFTSVQLALLDEALTLASRSTKLPFSVYLGGLGKDSRAAAEKLHATTPNPATAVLVAVSPGERLVEIVTGQESSRRLPDNGCRLAVMAMVASFKEGDLIGGLVSGLRMMADQAGQPSTR